MPPGRRRKEFEEGRNRRSEPLWREFLAFIRENKAWWMVPILLVLLLLGALAWLSSTGAAPFIYSLF